MLHFFPILNESNKRKVCSQLQRLLKQDQRAQIRVSIVHSKYMPNVLIAQLNLVPTATLTLAVYLFAHVNGSVLRARLPACLPTHHPQRCCSGAE